MLKSQNKATFNPVQYCHPAEGSLYPGGHITGCIFLFPVRWAYNRGFISGGGGGGGGGLKAGTLRYLQFLLPKKSTGTEFNPQKNS